MFLIYRKFILTGMPDSSPQYGDRPFLRLFKP